MLNMPSGTRDASPLRQTRTLALISLALLLLLSISEVNAINPPPALSLVNTCTAENHAGAANISCSLAVSAGNWVVAAGTAAGTNAACPQNPILGINAFTFDGGNLYTNWHGTNKLSTELYDSGVLSASSNLLVTLSGQCLMNFSVLMVYQFTGMTAIAPPASVNLCNASSTGATLIACSLTALNGYGWMFGHVSADCASCSYSNQVNTITQASGTNFTDYTGIVKQVTPNVANAFTMTNSGSFNGGIVALSLLGNVPTPTNAALNLDNAIVAGSALLTVLVTLGMVVLIVLTTQLIATLIVGRLVLSDVFLFGVGILFAVILAAVILALLGSFDPVLRGEGFV